MTRRFCCLILVSSFSGMAAHAQITGTRGTATDHAFVVPRPSPAQPLDLGTSRETPRPLPPGPLHRKSGPRPPGPFGAAGTVTNADFSPPLAQNFSALLDDDTSFPPDTHGAVGTNFIVVALNTQVRYMDRSGGVIQTMSLSAFWSAITTGTPFDPRILYDPYANRWILSSAVNDHATNSSILLAVSADSSPTGTWYQYRVDADSTDISWADYDSTGFNTNWIVVHTHMFRFDDTFTNVHIYCFDKTNLYAGATNAAFTIFADNDAFGMVPAETYDPALTRMYLLEEWLPSIGQLRMSAIDGPVGSETLNLGIHFPTAASSWDFFDGGNEAICPQLGSTEPIAANDSRMQEMVYRNGSVWSSHAVFLPAGGVTRSAIQWWQISTNGTVQQFGRIEDTNSQLMAGFPSIAVNRRGDALIGYTCFAPKFLASACYAYRASNDPPNTLRAARLLKAGKDVYYKAGGDGENRWGDYSHTVVDPVDDTSLWTIQEYAETRSFDSRWGTWWGKVTAVSNRAPQIETPGVITLPVGAATGFAVSVSDPDGNSVTLTNIVAPTGAVFTLGTLTWTATPSYEGTTSTVSFEANDGQGLYNSDVTNSTLIVVPFDSDGDFISDAWEFQHFGTLTNPATADPDGDGANNYTEYISGTQPTNVDSDLEIAVLVAAAPTGRQITVATVPAQRYVIEYSDNAPSDSATWLTFANLANGVGTWLETNLVATNHTFIDDEGTNTTAGASTTDRRGYRVRTFDTNLEYTVYLREQTNGIAVDGVVSPAEYGVARAQYVPDADNGFGGNNNIGSFFAAYASNTLYIGLQGATLENAPNTNGIVIYFDSPKLAGGWRNPALGADQGEVGDGGTPFTAESLITRANVALSNFWLLPGEDFADLGFGVVDTASTVSQAVVGVRDSLGLYSFVPPQSGNDLGFVNAPAVWKDTFTTNGGLEFAVPFSALGGVTTGDVIRIVAFITSISGFTSDETLPGNLINSGSPGFNAITFGNSTITLKIGGSAPP